LFIGPSVVELGEVSTVDDHVVLDVVVAPVGSRWRAAAFDVAPVSDRVVVDGVARPSVRLGNARVERDALPTARPQVQALARHALRRVGDLHDLRQARCKCKKDVDLYSA